MKESDVVPSIIDVFQFRKKAKAWQERFDALAPKHRDVTPDFELRDANDEKHVRLSDLRGRKPVVLVFGSFT